jgi:hypothetical protein
MQAANIVEIRLPLTNQMMLGLSKIFTMFTDDARRRFENKYAACGYWTGKLGKLITRYKSSEML